MPADRAALPRSAAPARALRAWWRGLRLGADAWAFYAAAAAVGVVHLVEVHLLDARAGAWARAATGYAFDHHALVEAPLARAIDALQPAPVLAAVTVFYLAGYVAILLAVPALVAATGDGALLRRTLLAYPVLYLLALPFFLFDPSVNPYVHLGLANPFASVHPRLEDAYYLFTTRDNTFPSLHVGFTALLVARVRQSRQSRAVKTALTAHGVLLAASVVYLRVHWVADAVAGVLFAWAALRLTDACLATAGRLSGVGRAFERASATGRAWRERAFARAEARLPALRTARDAEAPTARAR